MENNYKINKVNQKLIHKQNKNKRRINLFRGMNLIQKNYFLKRKKKLKGKQHLHQGIMKQNRNLEKLQN